MDGIFISYRRDDTAGYAGRLYDRLSAHFGATRVFMDVEGIEPGTDFVTAIEQAVGSCRVLIVLMGEEWLGLTDKSGRRRLDDPNDFIRLETCAALARDIRVIPVLVEGAGMPLASDLPEELRPLTRRQAIEISHKQWEASTGELIRVLEPLLRPAPEPIPTPPEAITPPSPPETESPPTKPEPKPEPIPKTKPESAPSPEPGPNPGKKWLLPVITLAGLGLAVLAWQALKPESSPPAPGPVAVAPSEPAPAPTPISKPTSPPAPTPAPPTTPEPTPATPPAVAPAPTPSPAPKPIEEPPRRQPAGPTPAPVATKPAPVIRAFNSRVEGTKATLCYRIENANSAVLLPRPGTLARADKACVTVQVKEPTTFTLSAQGPGGSATSPALELAPAAAPAPPPVASPALPKEETTAPAPAGPGQPRVGESWTYQTRGMWPTSPRKTLQFVVRGVDGATVTEELRQLKPEGRGSEQQRSRGGEAGFLGWNDAGSEFSPYLGTRLKWTGEESWSNIATPNFDANWRDWWSRAKITGQETVQVPAGSFRAWKVEVWSSRAATGGRTQAEVEPVRIRYLIWYAPELARYVRMERKILSAGSTTLEEDIFELVAHRGGS